MFEEDKLAIGLEYSPEQRTHRPAREALGMALRTTPCGRRFSKYQVWYVFPGSSKL
jgi:hypothetical protein